MTRSVRIGRYALEVGPNTGSIALFEQARENEHARALGEALDEEPEERATQVEVLEDLVETAETVTNRIDHANKLFQAAAEGRLLDRDFLTGEIGALLALLQRLDKAKRYDEELRLARALHGLLVLASRWLQLVRSLRMALGAVREAGDEATQAWALHELGTLHLCAGRARQGKEYLEAALALEEKLGDAIGRCSTRHNLDSARRDLAQRAHLLRLRRIASVVGALTLALVGGSAAAFIFIDGSDPQVDQTTTLAVDLRGGGSGSVTRGTTINCPPDCDETLEAGTSVTLTARAAGDSTFIGWEDVDCEEGDQDRATCTVKVDEDMTVGAVFEARAPGMRRLTVELRGGGSGSVSRGTTIDCPNDCDESVEVGMSVTLTARAASDSTFIGWEDVDCEEGVQNRATCTVKVDEDVTVGAVFEPLARVSLSVRKAGGEDSGTVTSDGGDIACGNTCEANFVRGSEVKLTAIPIEIADFVRWDGVDCEEEDEDEERDPRTCSVNIVEDLEVVAVFNPVE